VEIFPSATPERDCKEDKMTTGGKQRSTLPWIAALAGLAVVCLFGLMCMLCSAGAVGAYLLLRPVASFPAAAPASPPAATDAAGPEDWRQAGDVNAKVVVEEFADYQCPFCGGFHADGEPKLRKEYIQTGKVRFIFRNYPVLDGGAPDGESHLAALGAMCAGEQGKFWEYHDSLFENQSGENMGGFAAPRLLGFAVDLGLSSSAFDQCLKSKRYQAIIEADYQLGKSRGLDGVPTFIINGKTVLGFNPTGFFEVLDQALND
jgi:protein-disulfide isomerase